MLCVCVCLCSVFFTFTDRASTILITSNVTVRLPIRYVVVDRQEHIRGTSTKLQRGCVCVFSSHPFWTSSSLDVPAGVTQEEGHTGFLIHLPSAVRALIFVARRIQPFLSLVDREVEFCVLTN